MSFFRSSDQPASGKIENVLGPSADFRGSLKAEGGVRIDGTLEGGVESGGNVIIGKDARVIADVSGYHVTIAGSVEGDVRAVGRLEILSTGRLTGDVQADSFLIEEGGVFHGQSLMDTDEGTLPEGGENSPGSVIRDHKERQAQKRSDTR